MSRIFSSDHHVKVSPSIVVFTFFFLVGMYFLFYVRSVLAMLFCALIMMAAFNPGVKKLQRWLRIPRFLAIVMMYALVVGFLAVAMALIIPPLANEIQGFTRSFDFIPLQEELKHFRFSLTEASQLLNSIGGSVTTLMNVITSTFSGIFTVFSILVMSFYLISDRENLYKKISWISKDDRHLNLSKELIDSIELQLGGWIRGQFILMTLIGVVDFIGLSLLNVPFALPLALLAGGLEILPNLGPTIAAVPGIVLAYSSGGWVMAAVVTLFYLVVQQLENNLIVPKIMKANVDVNPLATILTMLIGVKIAGVVGALLAVPCYIILRSLYSLARREKWEW